MNAVQEGATRGRSGKEEISVTMKFAFVLETSVKNILMWFWKGRVKPGGALALVF